MDTEKLLFGVKAAGGAMAALLTFLFGRPDYWLWALIAFIAMDYITGVTAAVMDGGVSSKKGLRGILRKVMTLIPVAVGQILDTALGAGGALRNAVIGFLVANEGISLLENTARCGVRWPKRLIDVLEQLREE